MTVKASDINSAIAAKYSDAQWRVWFEVSQSTGYNSGRRADAVVMNIWPSKDYQVNVFEVKVSRGDFKNETSDLSKWQAIGQYADFFWLACPVGMVKPEEVPEAWGLMELTKGGLRIKKQAPARAEPAALDRGFVASLLRSGEDLTQAEIDKRVSEGVESGRTQIQRVERARAEREISTRAAEISKLNTWKAEFEEKFGCNPSTYVTPSKMAERIHLASRLERSDFDQIARSAGALKDAIEAINVSPKEADRG